MRQLDTDIFHTNGVFSAQIRSISAKNSAKSPSEWLVKQPNDHGLKKIAFFVAFVEATSKNELNHVQAVSMLVSEILSVAKTDKNSDLDTLSGIFTDRAKTHSTEGVVGVEILFGLSKFLEESIFEVPVICLREKRLDDAKIIQLKTLRTILNCRLFLGQPWKALVFFNLIEVLTCDDVDSEISGIRVESTIAMTAEIISENMTDMWDEALILLKELDAFIVQCKADVQPRFFDCKNQLLKDLLAKMQAKTKANVELENSGLGDLKELISKARGVNDQILKKNSVAWVVKKGESFVIPENNLYVFKIQKTKTLKPTNEITKKICKKRQSSVKRQYEPIFYFPGISEEKSNISSSKNSCQSVKDLCLKRSIRAKQKIEYETMAEPTPCERGPMIFSVPGHKKMYEPACLIRSDPDFDDDELLAVFELFENTV
jgi:hypothetical protein